MDPTNEQSEFARAADQKVSAQLSGDIRQDSRTAYPRTNEPSGAGGGAGGSVNQGRDGGDGSSGDHGPGGAGRMLAPIVGGMLGICSPVTLPGEPPASVQALYGVVVAMSLVSVALVGASVGLGNSRGDHFQGSCSVSRSVLVSLSVAILLFGWSMQLAAAPPGEAEQFICMLAPDFCAVENDSGFGPSVL